MKNKKGVDKYRYGGQPAEVEPAAGAKGTIIRAFDGAMMFRVYHDNERFTDYAIRHDELSVTIDKDAMAAFYITGEHNILDHSPQVLGLEKIEN
jgi:hypothetical protein